MYYLVANGTIWLAIAVLVGSQNLVYSAIGVRGCFTHMQVLYYILIQILTFYPIDVLHPNNFNEQILLRGITHFNI